MTLVEMLGSLVLLTMELVKILLINCWLKSGNFFIFLCKLNWKQLPKSSIVRISMFIEVIFLQVLMVKKGWILRILNNSSYLKSTRTTIFMRQMSFHQVYLKIGNQLFHSTILSCIILLYYLLKFWCMHSERYKDGINFKRDWKDHLI